jgi:pimeloyl-ACP methyl ester carboxylesterase
VQTFRRGLAVAVTALVVVTLPAAATTEGRHARYLRQEINWSSCPFGARVDAKPSQCARITVPRDWSDTSAGADLQVAISRVPAIGNRLGAILVNPGGPGGRGTPLAGALAGLEPSVNEHYDFVGMDPRGTGQEGGDDEGFVCHVPLGQLPQDNDVLDARDRSARSIALHQRAPRAVAKACQNDAVAPYITTWQTAHDMDLIRTLLGDEKLNYLGYSYGTWLGAKYASLFPHRAGKVVLDSSVNFEGRLQAAFEAFPTIDQREFDRVYAPWLARRFPAQLGTAVAEVKEKWERVRTYFKSRGVSPDWFDHLFVGHGNPRQWLIGALVLTRGASALDGATASPPAALKADLDRVSRAVFGVPAADLTAADVVAAAPELEPDHAEVPGTRLAVACGDQPTRAAVWYKLLSDRQGPAYPLFGWAYGLGEPCGYWSGRPRHDLPTLPARAAKNVLVVQGEFDPQTGYEQAEAAARAADVPMVSVADSPFHGQYAVSGNSCVDDLVNTYFLGKARPAATICPGVPLPGESQVFPAAGPAGQPVETPSPRIAPSTARQRLQEDISTLNRAP